MGTGKPLLTPFCITIKSHAEIRVPISDIKEKTVKGQRAKNLLITTAEKIDISCFLSFKTSCRQNQLNEFIHELPLRALWLQMQPF